MPLWNDAHIKRMMFIGFSRKNELPMARLYSFHAFPLKFQMGERLMSPRNVFRLLYVEISSERDFRVHLHCFDQKVLVA